MVTREDIRMALVLGADPEFDVSTVEKAERLMAGQPFQLLYEIREKESFWDWELSHMKVRDITSRPIISTSMNRNADGTSKGFSDKYLVRCARRAIELKTNYLTIDNSDYGGIRDISQESAKELYEECKAAGVKVIDAYHNFKETPSGLGAKFESAGIRGADVVKIATKANSREDWRLANQLLELAADVETPLAMILMGPEGLQYRVVGPLQGSWVVYTAMRPNTPAVGPRGMYYLNEMLNIFTNAIPF